LPSSPSAEAVRRLCAEVAAAAIPLVCIGSGDADAAQALEHQCPTAKLLLEPVEARDVLGAVSRMLGSADRQATPADAAHGAAGLLGAGLSGDRLREMLDRIELIALIVGIDSRVQYCNEHFARLTGYSREEIIGADWYDLFASPQEGHRRHALASIF